jgi:hypothetical protein
VQWVGSPLTAATVGLGDNPATAFAGGTIAYAAGWPKRLSGGAALGGAGTYSVAAGYRWATTPPTINLVAIPVHGGVVRSTPAFNIRATTWSLDNNNVPSALTHNVLAVASVEPDPDAKPSGESHQVASDWVRGK